MITKKKITKDKLVTEKMLNNALSDLADSILNGMDKMFTDLKGDLQEFKTQNAIEHMEIRADISDLKRNTPTLTQHEKLKNDLDSHIKYHHLAS